MRILRTFRGRIAAIGAGLLGLGLGSWVDLLGQQSEGPAAASGGLDTWTALVVIVILVIALGGLVVYELVVRSRA